MELATIFTGQLLSYVQPGSEAGIVAEVSHNGMAVSMYAQTRSQSVYS